MTQEIEAVSIDTYRAGMRQLMSAAGPGTIPNMTKDGVVDVPYAAGDLLLANEQGNLICGPVSVPGAIDLAERILEGEQRAITHPLTLFTLAMALAGFRIELDPEAAVIDMHQSPEPDPK
ncbi:hypothetical protein [Aminobacter carboxidus]|uniref:Uncharacterized protein n=1 Tax=Aminobacter carboxidus TaxID=376165 RepID=A0ABR9GWV6_9HYPH|nr:hypothetical protein [Aminobacter carboxidus]MBE1208161.1 hypothetical protein [Aminobacter carboxidus]